MGVLAQQSNSLVTIEIEYKDSTESFFYGGLIMQETVSAYLGGIVGERNRAALSLILRPIANALSCQTTSTAGLVINGAGNAAAKIGAAAYAGVVKGVPVAIAAGTAMPALVGSITAASYNIFAFFIDSASVVTVAMGVEGTTLAKAKFPPFPEGKALVGYLVVTYASQFVGGTTALDTATTVYVSPTGAFDPSILN